MSKANKVILFSIVALGFCLRLYRVGAKTFWVDELGVAIAATMPTLAAALEYARGHVMAMPLDYVIAWLMAHISIAEGWLRLPEAIWGTLSLVAGFLLYREFLEERAALIATFLLALSPALIEYSQELRFYAPLIFFYTLSLATGLRASREGKAIHWLVFTMTCCVGIFFHIYAALVLIPVSLWTITERDSRKGNFRFFSLSIFLILLGAVYAIYSYGSFPGEKSELFAFESVWQVILGGFGWIPSFPATTSAWLFGTVCLCFAVPGIYDLLASSHRKYVLLLLISIGLQIGILFGMTAIKNYFASARQFLILVPLSTLLSAAGIDVLIQKIRRRYTKRDFHIQLLNGATVLSVGFLAYPALQQYYALEKGATRPILHILNEKWQQGQSIYVMPGYERDVYAFYAKRLAGNSALAGSFVPLEIKAEQTFPEQVVFLIATPSFDATSLGFEPIFVPPANTLYPHVLWQKH